MSVSIIVGQEVLDVPLKFMFALHVSHHDYEKVFRNEVVIDDNVSLRNRGKPFLEEWSLLFATEDLMKPSTKPVYTWGSLELLLECSRQVQEDNSIQQDLLKVFVPRNSPWILLDYWISRVTLVRTNAVLFSNAVLDEVTIPKDQVPAAIQRATRVLSGIEQHQNWWDLKGLIDSAILRILSDSAANPIASTVHKSKLICSGCGLRDETLKLSCARCRRVYYCSRECQVEDWTRDHKQSCSRVRIGISPASRSQGKLDVGLKSDVADASMLEIGVEFV
jgi:hypothetical protein